MTDTDDAINLGPCCACEATGPMVRTVMMLDLKGPEPGKGWGCIVCGLPGDGAQTVLCNACVEAEAEPRFAVSGYLTEHGRVPIETLTEPFVHDEAKHRLDAAKDDLAQDLMGRMFAIHELAHRINGRIADITAPSNQVEVALVYLAAERACMAGRDAAVRFSEELVQMSGLILDRIATKDVTDG